MGLGSTSVRDLLTLDEAREMLGKDARDGQHDLVIQALISGVSQTCESFIGHPILHGTYTYDGTERPLISGTGCPELVLPISPVESISRFRRVGKDADFVEGSIDEAGADYVLDHDHGIATFRFDTPRIRNLYELTIVGGFERDLSDAAEAGRRGWPEGNYDLWLSMARQIRHLWRSIAQNREDIQSVSVEGMTTSYIAARLLPDVLATWRAQRDWRA